VLRIPYFAEFVADILGGNPKMLDSLRQATRDFVQACRDANAVGITDSIYPCVNWLIATDLFSDAEIVAFGAELEQLLAPLHPLVVFLDADPVVALQRAIDQRGAAWFEGLLAALNSYAINRARPLHTLEDAAAYFRVQSQLSLEVLQKWSCDLLLIDAVQTPVDEVKAEIMRHLGLEEIQGQPSLVLDEMQRYVGLYQAEGTPPITNPLAISIEAGKLWVNTYWPNGCPLLAEGDGQFRLESTSHRIHFEMGSDGVVSALTYRMGDNDYHFAKVR
jgi:hypothetical protein